MLAAAFQWYERPVYSGNMMKYEEVDHRKHIHIKHLQKWAVQDLNL